LLGNQGLASAGIWAFALAHLVDFTRWTDLLAPVAYRDEIESDG
jgi:hypothetical protein